MKKLLCLISIVSAITVFYPVFAQEEIKIEPLTGEIDFDGNPGEPAWQLSRCFPMVMHYPVYNGSPTEKSEVYITFDNNYLWIGAKLYYNDISKLVSTSKKRDETSENSDYFGILLDSYNDNENALAFFTMPSGLKIDYTVANDAAGRGPGDDLKNYTWNSFWDVKNVKNDEAWLIEMRIPFSSLRFQSVNDITKMGLIINRGISHCNEIDTYPAIDTKYGQNAKVKPSLGQTIVFEQIKPRNPLYISPYLMGGISQNYDSNEAGDDFVKPNEPKLTGGLDVKYNLNNNLTLDFTVNTDFAQVEADDEQVNLTRYSLFFPEKRLFFQERASIFSFSLGGPQDLFYSRNIGIVDGEMAAIPGGARLVGRLGKWDIGILDMNTAKFNGNPAENFGVARVRKQVINENSYIGGMLTSRLGFDGSYNVGYGLDGIIRVFGDDYLDVKVAQTIDNSLENNVASLDPTFFRLAWERRSEEGFGYSGVYAYWGKDFNPESGFIFLNNLHEFRGEMQYGWFPEENSAIFSYRTGIDFEMLRRIEDGQLENMEISPEFEINFKNGFGAFTGLAYRKEGVLEDFHLTDDVFVPAGNYDFYGFHGFANSPRTKKLVGMVGFEAGQFYDGNRVSFNVDPELNLSSSFQITAGYQFDHVIFPTRDQKFTNNIGKVKITYMVNTKISMSAFVQYNEIDNILITNYRLRYNPRDGNDFYLVLNDMRNSKKTGSDDLLPPFINQTVMLKYTHTFRL